MRYRCHWVQGFLLSRPVVAEDVESLLSTRSMPMPCPADTGPLYVPNLPYPAYTGGCTMVGRKPNLGA